MAIPDILTMSMNETPKKHHPLKRLILWIKTHRRWSLIIGGLVLILITSLIAWSLYNNTPLTKLAQARIVNKPKPVVKYYSPLTGNEVADLAASEQAVTAIMIENSPDARPQSGLKEAGVVYEAVAEGGITRFLALYQQEKPGIIGPVRSVRMYYVDWVAPYQASVAHIGGSYAALQEVRNGSYRDIDQFFNSSSYWRSTDRYAPHNVYTSFEKLDALNASKGYTKSSFSSFPRADAKPPTAPNATSIDITISSPWYNPHYAYDAASNTYLRSLGGVAHNDREKGQIAPSVVVALYVDMTTVLEDGYRESIVTSGSGRAVVFQNGSATECTWKKTDKSSPLTLLDASGKPLSLIRGQTWISAVPSDTGGASWQ